MKKFSIYACTYIYTYIYLGIKYGRAGGFWLSTTKYVSVCSSSGKSSSVSSRQDAQVQWWVNTLPAEFHHNNLDGATWRSCQRILDPSLHISFTSEFWTLPFITWAGIIFNYIVASEVKQAHGESLHSPFPYSSLWHIRICIFVYQYYARIYVNLFVCRSLWCLWKREINKLFIMEMGKWNVR